MNSTSPETRPEAPPPPDLSPNLFRRVRDTLVVFMPAPLQKLIERGLFKTFLLLVLVFVLAPVLTAYVAAFWVKTLGRFDNRMARGLREEILIMVSEGFNVEEVANKVDTASNQRLDYFQNVNVTFASNDYVSIPLAVENWQIIRVKIDEVSATTITQGCPVPEGIDPIVELGFGETLVESLTSGNKGEYTINEANWKKIVNHKVGSLLTLRATQSLRENSCKLEMHVKGAIKVYKGEITHADIAERTQ